MANTKINNFRKNKRLSIEELAKRLGYSVSFVKKVVYGEREPSRSFYTKLKKEFPDTDMNIFFEV